MAYSITRPTAPLREIKPQLALMAAEIESALNSIAGTVTNLAADPYNADTTGTSSFRAAIMQAIADGHRRIYLPAGTYLLTQADYSAHPYLIQITTGSIEIFGDGTGLTFITLPSTMTLDAGSNEGAFIDLLGIDTASVHGITFQGASTVTGPDAFAAILARFSTRCRIFDNEFVRLNSNNTAGAGAVSLYQPYNAAQVSTLLGTTIAAGTRTVTPSSMAGIYQGRRLVIGGTTETVVVTSISATTFTATFANAHTSADSVAGQANAYSGHLVARNNIHNCAAATGIVVNSSGNQVIGNRIYRVGNTSQRHGLYVQAGSNVFSRNWIEGIGGYSIHQYPTFAGVTEMSGNKYTHNTSIDPGAFHVLISSEYEDTSNGANVSTPAGLGLSRYTIMAFNLFKNSRLSPTTITGNITLKGPTIFVHNTLEDVSDFDSRSPYSIIEHNIARTIFGSPSAVFTEGVLGGTAQTNSPGGARTVFGQSADPAAGAAGGDLFIAPGIGSRKFTVLSNTAGAVAVTIRFTGPGDSSFIGNVFTLTSGVEFALGSNNTAGQLAVTAANLAEVINTFSTTLYKNAYAVAIGADVLVVKGRTAVSIVLSSNQSGRISASNTDDGSVRIDRAVVRRATFRPAQITSDQDNWDPGALADVLVVTTDAARNITGMTAGGSASAPPPRDGEQRMIVNDGAFTLTLKHQSASSAAASRFFSESLDDVVLQPRQAADLYYDAAHAYWRVHRKAPPLRRLPPNVAGITSSATPAPAADFDLFIVSALAANATFAAPTGTAVEGSRLVVRIKDNGTARTLAWNAVYQATTPALPTTTTVGSTLYLEFMYNAAGLTWDLLVSAIMPAVTPPPPPAFILSETLGTLRNNANATVGFTFTTPGSSPPTITALGRWKVAGNVQTHTVYLYNVTDGVLVDSVSIDMTGGSAGSYVYATLGTPVTLATSKKYYVGSAETNTGDQWYNDDTTVDSVDSAAGTYDSSAYDATPPVGPTDSHATTAYGPVNFLFS